MTEQRLRHIATKSDVPPYQRYANVRKIPATFKFECAGCGYTHADIRAGVNYWHEECLEMHKKEFHNPPERIVRQSKLRLSLPTRVGV